MAHTHRPMLKRITLIPTIFSADSRKAKVDEAVAEGEWNLARATALIDNVLGKEGREGQGKHLHLAAATLRDAERINDELSGEKDAQLDQLLEKAAAAIDAVANSVDQLAKARREAYRRKVDELNRQKAELEGRRGAAAGGRQ
jgi:hypothetical protein